MTDRSQVWAAVVVAAGTGSRYGGDVPKQFTKVAGTMVIDHSVGFFRRMVPVTVVVLPRESPWSPPEGVYTAPGGTRRQDSVRSGVLRAMELGATHVLVHDGARPYLDESAVRLVIREAERTGAALPCIPVRETVKRVSEGKVAGTVDRTGLQLAQTPQGYEAGLLLRALNEAPEVTDESMAVELLGIPVSAVAGSPMNVKLTEAVDREVLERFMAPSRAAIGTGLDFHPFDPGRPLSFCGCRLSSSDGLAGHSDGDAVLHAVSDAVLAASRLGDVGTLFPPGDPLWKDADSGMLLSMCMEKARDQGWELLSLDVTVIGEKPRISPIRDRLRGRLAEILCVDVSAVWIKGTTTNSIGELGRGKGVGCHAIAELVKR